jgi:putative ABC transport system ATP-binding protein
MFARFSRRPDVLEPKLQTHNRRLVEMHQVVKTYQSAAGDFTALKGIDLYVDTGEFIAIVGKSGSGKSTLLNILTGIDSPTSGEVFVGGTPVHALNQNQIAAWRGHTVGVVFQFYQLLPTLTVAENVMLPMDFCNTFPTRERRARAMRLLQHVGIAEQADKVPTALSGGQQQRVAIARALANDPPLLIADEPTGNLDSRTAEAVFQLFAGLVDDGKTVVMVTHDSDLTQRADRVITIADGMIANQGYSQAATSIRGNEQPSLPKTNQNDLAFVSG